jgi:hypothetical protein
MVTNPKILEPNEDDTLESILKKTPHDDIEIMISNK